MKFASLATGAALLVAATSCFAVGSLADVTLLDRSTGRSLTPHYSDGHWYVAGRPGAAYEIRVRNVSGADLLGVVSVDGVNVITGETAATPQSGYVVPAGTTLPVSGWRKDMTRIAAFVFTSHDNAYATRTGRPDNVGVIGVALFRRKVEAPPIAVEEESWRGSPRSGNASQDAASGAAPAASARRRAEAAPMEQKSLGTGHGRSETNHARYALFERESDAPNEVITIYYDSRENLVERGILPPARPPAPQPFPNGFVPDPPNS
ncbi:MAG: hypothetical protein U1F52_14030 [Burkholderiales bacterium]